MFYGIVFIFLGAFYQEMEELAAFRFGCNGFNDYLALGVPGATIFLPETIDQREAREIASSFLEQRRSYNTFAYCILFML